MASAGGCLLLWLYVSRTFSPASAHVVKPLYFDYTQLQAVAATSLVSDSRLTAYANNLREANPKKNTTRQLIQGHRFLAPGEVVSMWVDLRMPRSRAASADLFQAIGELHTADGQQLARSSRPTFPVSSNLLSLGWGLWAAPLRALGLWASDTRLQVVLFERYTEQADQPFAIFMCTLHGRAGGGLPPPVASADLHIKLHIGTLRRILYWVRPGDILTICLGVTGVCAFMCGWSSAAVLFALWLWSVSVGARSVGASSPDGSPLSDDGLSSGDEGSRQPSGQLSDSDESAGWVIDMGDGEAEALPSAPLPPCQSASLGGTNNPDYGARRWPVLDEGGSVVASSSEAGATSPPAKAAAPIFSLSSPKRRR